MHATDDITPIPEQSAMNTALTLHKAHYNNSDIHSSDKAGNNA